ncbi:MAG TPA: LptE family protein [Longimicrobiales bacterium]|nr:LptE family protein [Longimicrobiales bacterium]
MLAVLAVVALGGCNYGFRGGGGFPPDIRTIYIAPFDNQTAQFDLERQLYDQLSSNLPKQLGIRTAPQDGADAILTGRITRYDDVQGNYKAQTGQNPQVLTNEIQISISAQLVDVKRNLIIWETNGLTGRGSYKPAESDQVGQTEAVKNLVEQVIDGAQSQW